MMMMMMMVVVILARMSRGWYEENWSRGIPALLYVKSCFWTENHIDVDAD